MINFYTRARCPMCDEAERALTQLRVQYRKVDVSQEPALEAEYGSRVPVIEAGGELLFEGGMNPSDLEEILAHIGG